jgi:hypothetical protein
VAGDTVTVNPAWYPDIMAGTPHESRQVGTASLSSDLSDPQAVPYFLWDEPMTVAELRARLSSASPPERARLLGKILREARDTDVWLFTTPAEVAGRWNEISRHLGRRREFWQFLLGHWSQQGRLDVEWAR